MDRRSLAEIYGNLKSPSPTVTVGWENITGRLLNFSDNLSGLGMRSSLYKYQRRSVAAMIQQELDPSDVSDPLFISLRSMENESFYLQPGTMEVLRERPTTAASQSGILCEELGTGKTVMILALVLATLNQLSTPEPSIIDERPVMTPLSFRHFPSPEYAAARKSFLRRNNEAIPVEGPRIPSLVELLLHRRRTTPDTTIHNIDTPCGDIREEKRRCWTEKVENIPQGAFLPFNTPFYYHYHGSPTVAERSARTRTEPGPRVVYLTSATLIVVPSNLLSQWDREIHKHCEYHLRVLIMRSGTPMPSAASLASEYDIILMTYTRFTTENKFNKIEQLHSWNVCSCPYIPGSRLPDCKCKFPGVSPLLQIRWKRLVIDEGHVSASLSTLLTPFTKMLSVERRWIVTGTPTQNLLGLSLGKKLTEKDNRQAKPSDSIESDNDLSDSDSDGIVGDHDPSAPPSRCQSPASMNIDNRLPRVWTKYDREDLGKLGKMISHFVAVPQFTASPKLVSTHVIEPLLDPRGPRPGAIQVLNQVMEMIMIRHRIEDVEKEVVLPQMEQEAILLDLDPYAAKSYNAMQAALAINAVDSQRIDQNADALQTTVRNMTQAMFWSSDDALFSVDEMLKNSPTFIRVASERNAPPEDMELLNKAVKHIKDAAEDSLWRAIQSHEDVPYRVVGLKRRIFEAWTRTPLPKSADSESFVGLVHSDRLLEMQDCAIRRPLISEDALVEHSSKVAANDALLRRLYIESQKGKNRNSAQKVRPHQDDINAGLKAEEAAKKARDPGLIKEMKKDLNIAMTRLDDFTDDNIPPSQDTGPTFSDPPGSSILPSSLLGSVRVCSSASSKLNYIINEVFNHETTTFASLTDIHQVSRYSADEKFLIFSDSELTLAHVAEALQLMHIKFLRFTTQIAIRLREQMVLTFETSDKYRVFLMELKHGARAFIDWYRSIWRAVKTLAIRGTSEENMVSRRNIFKGNHEKVPKLIEESGMRHFIANPKFIDYPPEKRSVVDMPLLIARPAPVDELDARPLDATSLKRIRPVDPVGFSSPQEPPIKKKRTVRFASE
ncbi:hypothetical protein DXG01_013485 [Tephrocybe rancida]|nr:hypothetical protein DXG01_013485 [Tephrocybe rancida]